MSQTKFSLFISSEVPKTRSIPFMEGKVRRFGALFVPDHPEASQPPSLKAEALGQMVAAWRGKAREAGWRVESWDHLKVDAA